MPNSTLEVCSSTNPQPPLVTKANCGLEVFLAAVLPPTGSRAPDACDLYRKTGAVPQNTHYIGGNMRDTQFQTIKPSGLRMPSPSLGFFCQVMSAKEMLFCLHRKYTRSLYPNRFGKRTIAGRVVKESYGAAKQQHTFTEADTEKQKRETEEMGDAMKSLENRTLDSKREMDILAALG